MKARSPSARTGVHTAILIALFVGCIGLANWALLHVGQDNGASAPRTLPVLPGLAAPSGVIFAGAILTLRDTIQERLGTWRTVVVVLASAPFAALLSTPGLAFASCFTFVAAELSDLAVFSRLRSAGFYRAAAASNLVSSVIDSALFLLLAFGAQAAASGTAGLVVGKFLSSLCVLGAVRVVTGTLGGIWRTAGLRPDSAHGESSAAVVISPQTSPPFRA